MAHGNAKKTPSLKKRAKAVKRPPTRGVPIDDERFVPEVDQEGIVLNDPDAPPASGRAIPSRYIGRKLDRPQGLAALRHAHGVTQVELAARMGVTQAEVSRIERNEDHRLSTLRAYVEALGQRLEVVAVGQGQGVRVL